MSTESRSSARTSSARSAGSPPLGVRELGERPAGPLGPRRAVGDHDPRPAGVGRDVLPAGDAGGLEGAYPRSRRRVAEGGDGRIDREREDRRRQHRREGRGGRGVRVLVRGDVEAVPTGPIQPLDEVAGHPPDGACAGLEVRDLQARRSAGQIAGQSCRRDRLVDGLERRRRTRCACAWRRARPAGPRRRPARRPRPIRRGRPAHRSARWTRPRRPRRAPRRHTPPSSPAPTASAPARPARGRRSERSRARRGRRRSDPAAAPRPRRGTRRRSSTSGSSPRPSRSASSIARAGGVSGANV